MSENESNERETREVSVAEISQKLGGDMPEPDSQLDDQPSAGADESQGSETGDLTDRLGNSFDPDIHATDDDGNPEITDTGNIQIGYGKLEQAKQRAQGDEDGSQTGSTVGQSGSQVPPGVTEQENYRESAMATASAIEMTSVSFLGDHWRYNAIYPDALVKKYNLDEREQMTTAFEDYYRAKGISDIPPGIALIIAMVSYAGPRFFQEETQSRWQKIKQWCTVKYLEWFGPDAPESNGDQEPTEDGA